MRSQRVIGCHRAGHHIRPRWLHTVVEVLAVIAPGPTVKRAILHMRHVIGHQVATDFIALVHRGPERAGLGVEAHAHRIANAAGENTVRAGGAIDFPNSRTAFLGRKPIITNVTVGAYRDVELAAVRAGHDVLGPMMINRAAR